MQNIENAFENNIDPEWLTTLQIATFLDPCHKDFNLKRMSANKLRKFKKDAVAKAKAMYDLDFKGAVEEPQPPQQS